MRPSRSFARLSSRFSFSSSFSRARSSVVSPGSLGRRRSRSADPLAQRLGRQAELAGDAGHRRPLRGVLARWSKYIRTARSRTSGENWWTLALLHPLKGRSLQRIPGRFILWVPEDRGWGPTHTKTNAQEKSGSSNQTEPTPHRPIRKNDRPMGAPSHFTSVGSGSPRGSKSKAPLPPR